MLYKLAYIFVFLTGFTGLIYQVTWHKYLSFYLGSHAMATSLVLAIFFLFLSLGYSILGRNIHKIPLRNKLFLYGVIEALIGFYALVSPELFHWLTSLVPAGGQSQVGDFTLGLAFTTLFIGLPTFLMGTTIPVLTQALSRDFDSSHGTHAAVYGLNTLGAVFGGLLTGFVLIDVWGLPLTLLNTGMLNLAVGFASWLIWKRHPDSFVGVEPEHNTHAPLRIPGWIFVLYTVSFASGFYVFSLENLFIRLAGLTIGSSSYTFAMIVAAFILGIALGSLWVGRRRRTNATFFLYVQLGLLASNIALYLVVPLLPEWLARIRVTFAPSYMNISLYWTAVFLAFTTVLLLPVALMGMNLPLIFNLLRSKGAFLSQTVGRIYGINTLGSVFGSLIGGYLLFFILDWDGVFRFNLIIIVITFILLAFLTAGRTRALGLTVSAMLITVILLLPDWDDHAFLPSPALINRADPTATSLDGAIERLRGNSSLRFVYEGPSAHIGVIEFGDGEPQLHINGNPNTGEGDWELRAMNAVYPLSFVDNPRRAFVVGLGAGLSSSIFAEMPSMEEVVVAEIAIGAIKALPYFNSQNDEFTSKPYFDKVDFVPADALKVLRSGVDRFDIIVSEPNHPWVAGVENLFSKEFLTEVRNRLEEDGVYCQWFPLFGSEPDTVLTILNTFREVFPEVRAFSIGGDVLSVLASREPLRADLQRIHGVGEIVGHRFEARQSAFADTQFLLATEALNDWSVAKIVEEHPAIHTFEFPVVASSAFRARFAGLTAGFRPSVTARLHATAPADAAGGTFLYESLRGELEPSFFDRAYETLSSRGSIASVMAVRLWYHRETWFDSEPDWPEPEQREIYSYLTGLQQDFPKHLKEPEQDGPTSQQLEQAGGVLSGVLADGTFESQSSRHVAETASEPQLGPAVALFNAYRLLIEAQVPAHLERVADAIPEECTTLRCADLMRAILFTALGGSEEARDLDQLNLSLDENRALIRSRFKQWIAWTGTTQG